jgi:hypothetical protein
MFVEYLAYAAVIALAVFFSYRAGYNYGVRFCIKNLVTLGVIEVTVTEDGTTMISSKKMS